MEEMEWTINWYGWQKDRWQGWANIAAVNEDQGMGHVAYAEKQVAMWAKFETNAKSAFSHILQFK